MNALNPKGYNAFFVQRYGKTISWSSTYDCATAQDAGHEPQQDSTEADGSKVELGTHFFRQRYLYAFATQAEVAQYIRTQAIPDESIRIADILSAWTGLQPRVQALIQSETGIAETIQIQDVPLDSQAQLQDYAEDALFQKTFFGITNHVRGG